MVRSTGAGPRLLFLHGEDGLLFSEPLLDRLAERFSVLAPSHPGWGRSPRPKHVTTIDDIAYVYLNLLETFDTPVTVVGVSVGAWIAAEIATKSTSAIGALVLVSPVGVKLGGREDRAFVDLYATSPDAVLAALYSDPGRAAVLSNLDADRLRELAMAQEAVARYTWEPYMHNPKLRHRLSRIKVPTLVIAGGDDCFVLEPDYFASIAALIGPHARVRLVPGAGHRIDEESPADVGRAIAQFAEAVRVESSGRD